MFFEETHTSSTIENTELDLTPEKVELSTLQNSIAKEPPEELKEFLDEVYQGLKKLYRKNMKRRQAQHILDDQFAKGGFFRHQTNYILECKKIRPELSVDHIIRFKAQGFSFSFNFLYHAKNTYPELTINDVKDIMKENQGMQLISISKCMNAGLPLSDVLSLLKVSKRFNFEGYFSFFTTHSSTVSITETLELLKYSKHIDFGEIKVLLQNGFDISDITSILDVYPTINFEYFNGSYGGVGTPSSLASLRIDSDDEVRSTILGDYMELQESYYFPYNDLINFIKKSGIELNQKIIDILLPPQIQSISVGYYIRDKNNNATDTMELLHAYKKTVTIGDQSIPITKPNIFAGIYELALTHQGEDFTLDSIIQEYEVNINVLLAENSETEEVKQKTDVFFLHVPPQFDGNSALQIYRKELAEHYTNTYGTCTDFFDTYDNNDPKKVYRRIKRWLSDPQNQDRKLLIDLGMHGNSNGTGETGRKDRTQEDFNRLFEIDDQRLTINITSCKSGNKIDEHNDTAKMIFLDSNEGSTKASIMEYFLEAYERDHTGALRGDYNGDGNVSRVEAKVYVKTHYHSSNTQLFWNKKELNGSRRSFKF